MADEQIDEPLSLYSPENVAICKINCFVNQHLSRPAAYVGFESVGIE